jgi:DNA-binding NarL/FixJ family response regulator
VKRVVPWSLPTCKIVGEAGGSEEALYTCQATKPDVILVDLSIDSGGGIALARTLRDTLPHTLIVIMSEQSADAMALLQQGCGFPCIAKTELWKNVPLPIKALEEN